MPNPYSYGPLVTDPTMFFGREAELDTLCTRLRMMMSTSVVGQRKIGKSWLLHQLTQTLRCELGSNYVPLYIDLQDARYRTVTGFVRTIAETLNERMHGILNMSRVSGMPGFAEMIERLGDYGIRPVLCLDRFERVTQHAEEFDDGFLEPLRALADHSKLAIVTASRKPLTALIRAGPFTSPFYNIFTQFELGLLDPGAAEALRRLPFERDGITLIPDDTTLAEELGGRHPFFLQMACHYLYEAQALPPTRRVGIVRERFNHEAEPHFERLWSHLEADARATLKKVALGQTITAEKAVNTLDCLAHLGLVEQANGRWRPFSTAFTSFIQQHIGRLGTRELPGLPKLKALVRSPATQFLLYAILAIIAVVIAAFISSLLPAQRILSTVVIAALILPFALVGAGKLTGRDFVRMLLRILNVGDFWN